LIIDVGHGSRDTLLEALSRCLKYEFYKRMNTNALYRAL